MPVFSRRTSAFSALLTICVGIASADDPKVPVFKDGEAQIVPEFKNPADWVRHDLWVETEFDSDGDGKLDRMHVDVTRQKQTDTEGLKVAVIYESSPYYAGTGNQRAAVLLESSARA
jgi:X-Pro dipeptidyl-peptidase